MLSPRAGRTCRRPPRRVGEDVRSRWQWIQVGHAWHLGCFSSSERLRRPDGTRTGSLIGITTRISETLARSGVWADPVRGRRAVPGEGACRSGSGRQGVWCTQTVPEMRTIGPGRARAGVQRDRSVDTGRPTGAGAEFVQRILRHEQEYDRLGLRTELQTERGRHGLVGGWGVVRVGPYRAGRRPARPLRARVSPPAFYFSGRGNGDRADWRSSRWPGHASGSAHSPASARRPSGPSCVSGTRPWRPCRRDPHP